MILRHLNLERQLEWGDSKHLCEFIIEDPKFLREVIKDLTISEEEKELSISVGGKTLNFDKDLDVVFNPLKLDFNSKRAMTTLLKMLLKTSVSEEFYLTTNKLKTKIVKYFSEIVEAEDFEFEVSTDDFTMDSVAKAVSIHIIGDEDDFVELLTDYVSMMSELASIKLFVFINLRCFMSDLDMERFHHNLDNHQINALLLESTTREVLQNTPRLIIDKDLCEI